MVRVSKEAAIISALVRRVSGVGRVRLDRSAAAIHVGNWLSMTTFANDGNVKPTEPHSLGSRRVGWFGGSFDPVHIGHLWIAEAAREQLHLDEVRFVPAATNPLKPGGPQADDASRLEMLRLATSGNDAFIVDDRELRRGEVSYTVETLRQWRSEFPKAKTFLLIGGDSLADFERWSEPGEILRLATLAVVRRGGIRELDYSFIESIADASVAEEIRHCEIQMPMIELSSTEIRQRVRDGQSIRYRVPAAVAAMIQNSQPYS